MTRVYSGDGEGEAMIEGLFHGTARIEEVTNHYDD